MGKYAKMAKAERKLPIIFMINEKMIRSEKWDGGMYHRVIADIMKNLAYRSVDAIMSVVSFGEGVHLWSGFKKYDEYTDKEWPKMTTSGKSVFNIGLTLVKDMLEDIDTTPEGNYDPIVVLISSDEVSPGYKNELKILKNNGRFKDIQRIGIADLSYDGSSSYWSNNYTGNKEAQVNSKAPQILKEFAGNNITLFISDIKYDSWCTVSNWITTEYKDEDTWFCPVLSMMELRYTEDEKHHARKICENETSGYKGLSIFKGFGNMFT